MMFLFMVAQFYSLWEQVFQKDRRVNRIYNVYSIKCIKNHNFLTKTLHWYYKNISKKDKTTVEKRAINPNSQNKSQ